MNDIIEKIRRLRRLDFNEINLIVKYAHTISRLANELKEVDAIPADLYEKYDVSVVCAIRTARALCADLRK